MSTAAQARAGGWCRRCGAAYVALTLDEANGACGSRCTKALRRRNPATSDGRIHRRHSRQRRIRRQRALRVAELAAAGQPCPACGKTVHATEAAARESADALLRKGHSRTHPYPCHAGYGWHRTSNRRLARQNTTRHARRNNPKPPTPLGEDP